MAHVRQNGGRFLTVLPRTRGEDAAFRAAVSEGKTRWRAIHDRPDDDGGLTDRFSVRGPEATGAEGYRLIWYHTTRKAQPDALTRHKRVERVLAALAGLQAKLSSPRTRYRERTKVAEAVDAVLREGDAEGFIGVTIGERTTEAFRQERRGRPGADTRYVRRQSTRFDLTCRVGHARPAEGARCDGVFPLITNVVAMSALGVLLAYKQQPMIEKRFSQLKTDFVVAPVFLKGVSRIRALLCVDSFAMLVESLPERELRRAMGREGVESLSLYPEGRPCRRPPARRVIDLFEGVRRHTLTAGKKPPVVSATELARL